MRGHPGYVHPGPNANIAGRWPTTLATEPYRRVA
jgi:hypothetical protein